MIRNKNRTGKFTTQKWSETKTNKSDKFTNEQEIKGNLKKKKNSYHRNIAKKKGMNEKLYKRTWKYLKMNKNEK